MQQSLSTNESDELVRLWRRRHTLASNEMGRLYTIVGQALQSCHPPELNALGEERQELVAQFIYCKVLRLDADHGEEDDGSARGGSAHSAPSNAFALCAYFRRYLIDRTRSAAFKRNVSIGEQISEDMVEAQAGAHESPEAPLAEHGLNAAVVHAAARAFIAALAPPERLLLCESFGNEAPGGLAGVAARHAIASYHYRAGRLGLVHHRQKKSGDWARTTLGVWITQELGIAIEPENMDAIRAVFQVLGAEASCA
jgi:hypothetical protein